MYTLWFFRDLVGVDRLRSKTTLDDLTRRTGRYCIELDCLHSDLEQIIRRIKRVRKVTKARKLSNIRWALAYHVDNFHVRVAAYREKLYRLVELLIKVKFAPGPGKNRQSKSSRTQPESYRQSILSALEDYKLSKLAAILRSFERDKTISKALKHRNAFAHSLVLYWDTNSTLAPVQTFSDDLEGVDPPGDALSRTVKKLEAAMHLYGSQKEKQGELTRILRHLNELRREICAELASA